MDGRCRRPPAAARQLTPMPLSMAELEAIAAANFAEDIEIPASAKTWTHEQAESYLHPAGQTCQTLSRYYALTCRKTW